LDAGEATFFAPTGPVDVVFGLLAVVPVPVAAVLRFRVVFLATLFTGTVFFVPIGVRAAGFEADEDAGVLAGVDFAAAGLTGVAVFAAD